MPICIGGGISKPDQVEKIIKLGVEKISVNSSIFKNPNLIKEASQIVGSQSVAVTIDYKKDFLLEDTLNTYSMEKRKLVEASPKQLNMSKIREQVKLFLTVLIMME